MAFGQGTGANDPAWSSDDAIAAAVIVQAAAATKAQDTLNITQDSLDALTGIGSWGSLVVTTGAQSVDSTWSSVATHEVFTITGPIEFEITAICSIAYTGADSISILFAGQTGICKFLKADADAGEIVSMNTPPAAGVTMVTHVINMAASISHYGSAATVEPIIRGISSNGLDFGYQIHTASAPAGILQFTIRYRRLANYSTVAAGAGGSL